MSAESPDVSRRPQTNSAPDDSGPEPPESESRSDADPSELPDPADRVREFLDEMGERAHTPLSECHGRRLRVECVEEDRRTAEVQLGDGGTERVEEVRRRESVPVWRAVAEMLEWHEEYHRSTLRLEYGVESDPTHRLLDIPLENSWMAAYQDQERARLKALERQTCGYETCDECETRWCEETDDHETEHVAGSFEEPVVVLTTRTAAGDGRPLVDHAREIASAWSDGGVRRSLRYILDERLDLDSDEWVRWTQGEPHTGKRAGSGYGGNRGYHHPHDIIILDAAGAAEDVTAETFRTLIESHVDACDHAGESAHDLDVPPEEWKESPESVGSVEVKDADEDIEESVASYAAAYLANESKDLLERSPEYLMWAATMWATGTQKGIKSDSANHAIAGDRCHHKHAEGDQEIPHAAEVRREPCRCADQPFGPGCRRCEGRGYHVVCLMCGSPWDVDQSQTLTAHRTADGSHAAVADGGVEEEDQTPEEEAEEELRSRWPSARAAAVVGGPTVAKECGHEEGDRCPLCATETESPDHTVPSDVPIPEAARASSEPVDVVAGFERPPKWKAKAVVRDGEELSADGGTVDRRPLKLPSAPVEVVAMAGRGGSELVCQECVSYFETPGEYARHGCEGGSVYVAWRPPTEPPATESVLSRGKFVDVVPDHLLDGDGEQGEPADGRDRGGEGELGERVVRYVEANPGESVVSILGKFGLPPGAGEAVQEVRR